MRCTRCSNCHFFVCHVCVNNKIFFLSTCNMLTLSIFLLSLTYSCYTFQESTTAVATIIASTVINVTDRISINNTDANKFNVSLVRITEPSTNIQTVSKNITQKDFRPSPQLETYIEYNNFPIVPANPEPKTIYSNYYLPPKTDSKVASLGMTEAVVITKSHSTEKPRISAQDKQYFPTNFEKPYRNDPLKYYDKYNYVGPTSSNVLFPTLPAVEWYNRLFYPVKSTPIPVAGHPYPFVSDMSKTTPKGMSEKPKMNPWKKAAKIFAAILPIGLLISALTPTILTIGPKNSTDQQCRKLARKAEIAGLDKMSIEKWSEPGCEARLLCETAVKEDSLDVETVKNLFWSFVSQNAEDEETAEDIEAVSNAIKEKNCDKILCRQKKKPRDESENQ